MNALQILTLAVGWVFLVFVGVLELLILWKMYKGTIDLTKLISEENGDASLSRFQFLIFTFVISMSLFLVIVSAKDVPAFPTTIPAGIFALLGISGGSYIISKGIQGNKEIEKNKASKASGNAGGAGTGGSGNAL
jgi:uncharacterized BrkB/YihY/UPF0761 family membrane protein